MRQKIIFALTIVSLLNGFTSCTKPLEFEMKSLSEGAIRSCKTVSCPNIDVEYVVVKGTSEVAKKINVSLKNFIIQSLYIGPSEAGSEAVTVEGAMEDFIDMYRIHSAEFPGLSAEYFAEVSLIETFISKKIVSIAASNYLYTGGAHGLGSTRYFNFDRKTGNVLTYEDLFQNVNALEQLAEETFRKTHDIAPNEGINAPGFWFEDDTFYLPDTFGISNKEVTLHYNPYDIAPYASGPVVVEIPMKTLEHLLKIDIE